MHWLHSAAHPLGPLGPLRPSAAITLGNLSEQFRDNCNWSSMAFNWSEQVAHKLSSWKCGQSQLRVNDDRNGKSWPDFQDLVWLSHKHMSWPCPWASGIGNFHLIYLRSNYYSWRAKIKSIRAILTKPMAFKRIN